MTAPFDYKGGVLHVSGTRVTLDCVIEMFDQGASPEEIAYEYDSLKLDDVYANIAHELGGHLKYGEPLTWLVAKMALNMMSPEQRESLRGFVEAGVGVVALHHAIFGRVGWRWWWEEVIGARYVLEASDSMPASDYRHDIWMKTETVAEHPVTKGVPPMLIYDEGYMDMWYSPEIQVLMKTEHEYSDGTLAWISPYDKAPVAVIQLGHGREAHNHPDFQKLVHNAILWAAGREP